MKSLHKAAAGATLALLSLLSSQATAAPIYSDNFNAYTFGRDSIQVDTGLRIGAWGSLPNWTPLGGNAIHAVDRGASNWAIMFIDANEILMNSGVAANTRGTSYTVSFDVAPAVYAIAQQKTAAGDKIHFEMLNSLNTVVASFDYATPAWTGSADNPFRPASFSYVGNGSGDVRLRIADLQFNGHFAGSVDNVKIGVTGDTSDVPEPATALLMLGGLCGLGLARRRAAARK
jgi:hypothetical protein